MTECGCRKLISLTSFLTNSHLEHNWYYVVCVHLWMCSRRSLFRWQQILITKVSMRISLSCLSGIFTCRKKSASGNPGTPTGSPDPIQPRSISFVLKTSLPTRLKNLESSCPSPLGFILVSYLQTLSQRKESRRPCKQAPPVTRYTNRAVKAAASTKTQTNTRKNS